MSDQEERQQLERARHLFDLRRYPDAEREVRACLGRNPSSGSALTLLVRILLAQQRDDEAVASAQALAQLRPDFEQAYRLLAISLARVKALPQAYAAAYRAVELAPQEWRTHHCLSDVLRLQGRTRDSLNAAHEASRLAPHESDPFNLIGLCLRGLRLDDQARQAFQEALRLNPENTNAIANLAALDASSGKLRAASLTLRTGLSIDPQSSALHSNYDRILVRLVTRLYLALLALFVALLALTGAKAPYLARAGSGLVALVVCATMTWLVVRQLPPNTHLWARGLLGRLTLAGRIYLCTFVAYCCAVSIMACGPQSVTRPTAGAIVVVAWISILARALLRVRGGRSRT